MHFIFKAVFYILTMPGIEISNKNERERDNTELQNQTITAGDQYPFQIQGHIYLQCFHQANNYVFMYVAN